MNMNLFFVAVMVIGFLYTVGFVYALWKDKNKPASIAVGILGLAIVILPFFSIFTKS